MEESEKAQEEENDVFARVSPFKILGDIENLSLNYKETNTKPSKMMKNKKAFKGQTDFLNFTALKGTTKEIYKI